MSVLTSLTQAENPVGSFRDYGAFRGRKPFVPFAIDVERRRGDDVGTETPQVDMRKYSDPRGDGLLRPEKVVTRPPCLRCDGGWYFMRGSLEGLVTVFPIDVDDHKVHGNRNADVRIRPALPPVTNLVRIRGGIFQTVRGARVLPGVLTFRVRAGAAAGTRRMQREHWP